MFFRQRGQAQQNESNPGMNDAEQNTVVDPTALQIAAMLDINLSEVGTAEQGTAMVAKGVNDLVMKMQELMQQGDESEVDENGNPIESEEPEVDENGNPIEQEPEVDEEGNPIEQEGEPEVDEDGNPIEQEPEEGDDEQEYEDDEDYEDYEESQPVAKKKRPFPRQLSLSHISPRMLNMARENRELKIMNLAESGCITPTTARRLQDKWLSDESIGLSLSNEDADDSFDEMIGVLGENGPVLSFREQTGHQSSIELPQGVKLELSEEELMSAKYNPMLADAARRE